MLVVAQTVNPLDYGLREAKTGEERYYALKKCHEDAVKRGLNISYKGIGEINITIPKNATKLPLPEVTDFAGSRMIVENQSKNICLFSMTGECDVIDLNGITVDGGDYRGVDKLGCGLKMVILQDETPWINTRLGYNSTTVYKRKDVIVVKEGIAQNKPIMPYASEQTQVKALYSSVTENKKTVKNLNFIRTPTSTNITNLLSLRYVYNVEVSNVSVTTPQRVIDRGDGCILVQDCALITMRDITIDGTYSDEKLTGYGMRLLNVYDTRINRMNAHGKWGIFGNYNVNGVTLNNCDINRFDVHYYGKNIRSTNCIFRDMYNQFASVYGVVSFKKCEFINEIPVLIESSFNAYTPFELEWQNCTFHLNKKRNYLITLFGIPEPYNDRTELRRKCLPNIVMKNCKVYLEDDVDEWMVVKTHGVKYKDSFDYIQDVNIKGVQVISNDEKPFKVYSEELKTTQPVNTKVKIKRKNK